MKPVLSTIIKTLIFLSGLAILTFALIKANISSFTHDESFSYLNYCSSTFMQIISFSDWYTNNHILNSLLMKYAEIIAGSSELALRFPNIILFAVYIIYSFFLFKSEKLLFTLSIFLLLITNPLLNNLFGLARGYGLSVGFMIMSFYHFSKFIKNKKRYLNLGLFHFGALMASLSNFTLLTFYASILLTFNIYELLKNIVLKNKFNLIKANIIHTIPLIIALGILFEPVRRVISYSNLNFGGKNNFLSDTIYSVIINTFHNAHIPNFIITTITIVIIIATSFSLYIIAKNIKLHNQTFIKNNTELILSTFIIISISAIIILLHVLFGSDYPIGRFAIFLFPLFIIHFGFLIKYFLINDKKKIIITSLIILSAISSISYITKSDMYAYGEWKYDMNTKNMLTTLSEYTISENNVNLGISWLFEPTINFYRITKNYNWLNEVNRNGISEKDHYRYLFKEELQNINISEYEIIKEYANSNTILIKVILK